MSFKKIFHVQRLRTLIIAALVLLGFDLCQRENDQVSASQPNIVIIYADDMGYGDLAIQNADSKIPTPNLDRLAREGLRFTDAHSSSGICTPSRYALLTGRYHWRKFHSIVDSWGGSVFTDELTLGEMLKAQGYTTACIGKWHLGFDWEAIRKPEAEQIVSRKKKTWGADAFHWDQPIPGGPVAHGFDYYFGDDVPNFPPYAWIENDRVLEAPTVAYSPRPVPTEGAAEGRPGPMVRGWKQDAVMPKLTEKVVQWLGEQRGSEQPFFLYWPWTSPHAPIVPSRDWKGKTEAGGYGDYMAQSDYHAGQVLQALEDNGLAENTIVIFTADNGPEKYAYDRLQNFQHRSAGPLRGLKRDIWEGGHRVPFVVRWPGHVEAGTVTDGLMSQIDIMATIAGIVGFDLQGSTANDSHDQIALWKGGPSARHSIVHNTNKNHYAVRQGNWVLIDARSGGISPVPAWFDAQNDYPKNTLAGALYDLTEDLPQRHNRFSEKSELVEQLKSVLKKTRDAGEIR